MIDNYRYRALKQIMEYEQRPMTPAADDIIRKFFDITQEHDTKDIVKALSVIQSDIIQGTEIALEMMDERAMANKRKNEIAVSFIFGGANQNEWR